MLIEITAILADKIVSFSSGTDNAIGEVVNAKFLKLTVKFTMGKVNIKPLADRVLVEPAAAEEKTASGIIIPDTAKEKPQKGTIVAVGSGKKDEPLTVKAGDTVLYGKYSGTEINFEGKQYLIIKESEIYAIL